MKELTSISETWLNSSNKVNQWISEQIPTQKKRILGVDQLTEDPSSSGQKDLVFVKSLADDTKVSIPGVERPWLSEAEGFIFPNHNTGRILQAESQRNTTDPLVAVTDTSVTDYDSADESSVCSTPLPPLKKLDGAESVSGPKTIKSIMTSKSTFKAKALKGVIINEPSSSPARCDIRKPIWYLDSGLSRHMTGVKSYLYKYVEQPGPKVVFGDDSTCTTEGYGSIKSNGSHEADECKQTNWAEQRNNKHKEKGEDGPEWIIRSKFEDELANFMLEKKSRAKRIGDMLVQHRISTQDPPFPAPPRPATDSFTEGETKKEGPEGTEPNIIQEPAPRPSILYQPSKSSNLPFSSRLKKQKKDDEDERLLLIFKQIHINLSFLEAMIHMPKGAKVLKDLLSHKEKLEKAASSVKLSEECSAIIQRNMPQKEGDPGSFILPCLIGPLAVKNALADLGASINLMPHSLFRRLGISKLKPTKMSIKLTDLSIKYPIRVCENLLVKISKFIFPVDFVVLEMDEDELVPIILRRPFLAMTRAVDTVNYDGEWTEEEEGDDPNEVLAVSIYLRSKPELPEHLEYAFLQENNQLPVVISSALSTVEKTKLLEVLQNHKGAIAWSITDINGTDSSFCTHKILMEDKFKPSVQHQRRVNPNIKEVVKKEVIKLLDIGLIYPIFDSPWLSPVQVVLKKGGMTVVNNKKDELISQRTVTGWCVCIDYRKLNNVTRKDHFPLLFIDQMLERLAGHEYYCFLDGFSGYFQIPISLEDQKKTTFTCPYGTFAYKRMPFGLRNALTTFQCCMTPIFHELIEDSMKVFMEDFSVFGSSFNHYLKNLKKMLKRCEETNLVLKWKKIPVPGKGRSRPRP
ncbi:DNA-directed DNA polymerase [Tanacetum coccineum]